MSWSVVATGKPAAVAEAVKKALEEQKCAEPEETIKNGVGESIAIALASMPADSAVTVEASGSQSPVQQNKHDPQRFMNELRVKIQPIHGFLE